MERIEPDLRPIEAVTQLVEAVDGQHDDLQRAVARVLEVWVAPSFLVTPEDAA